jgi:superfamily II DNA or RNA helicase
VTTTEAPAALRLQLRDYQEDALARSAQFEAKGVRKQLWIAATGLGKTVMFSALAERRGGRALILAHRDELVSQAAAKVREVWPGVDVGVVKGERDEVRSHVVVASVQTLSRSSRLERLAAAWESPGLLSGADPFDLVVVDEAHHATAASYRVVLDRLRAGEDGGPLLVGVTATPDRGDGKGLDDVFQEVTCSYDILWGIGHGYLADLRGKRVELDALDLGQVKVRQGDYEAGAAGRAMDAAGAPDVIRRAWQEHASDRKTLVFTPTVDLAQHVADEFLHHGIPAAMVSGATPLDERRSILRRFSDGELQVLANCAVLTEGYDEPSVRCVVIARPTKSRALYVQMVGRGTRPYPEKDDCLVLDVVGASREHTLVTIPSLFGIEGKEIERGDVTVTEAVAAAQEEAVRQGKLRAEEADLFARVARNKVAWLALHHDGEPRRYVCGLGKGKGSVMLVQATVGDDHGWLAGVREDDGRKRVLIRDVTLEMAQGVGEDYARKHAVAAALIAADAEWRKRKPTAKQLTAAGKWRLKVDPKWTAGELSDALERHIQRIKDRRSK